MKYNDLALEMAEDVHTFAQEFKAKYDESVSVKIGTLKNCVIFEDKHRRLDVTEFRDIITNLMCEYNSNLSIYKSLNNRSRKKEFVIWKQLYGYIGHKYGFSKSELGRAIAHRHCTIIHSIIAINNYIDTKDKKFVDIYNWTIKKLIEDVGITTRDYKGQDNTKSTFTIICN